MFLNMQKISLALLIALSLNMLFQLGVVAKTLTFTTMDGVVEYADYVQSSNRSSLVLLLHMLGRNRRTYDQLIDALIKQNFNILAVDFRGHGESIKAASGQPVDYRQFDDDDWAKLPFDVDQILSEAKSKYGIDTSSLAIVGASIGANVAAIESKHAKCLVLLSPGLTYKGLSPAPYLKSFRGRILIVASAGDTYAADSSAKLKELSGGKKATFIRYDHNDHGTDMFAKQSQLIPDICDFLKQNLR